MDILVVDTSVTVWRLLLLMLPALLLTYHFVHQQHQLIRWVGALFAGIWQFQWRLILLAAGIQLELWHFPADSVHLYGVPIDIALGCALLFGVLPRIVFVTAHTPRWQPGLLLAADMLVMTQLLPLQYHTDTLSFLCLCSVIAIIPAQLLAQWTETNTHLYARSILQNIIWALLLLWLFPALIFTLSAESWEPFFNRSWTENLLRLTPLLVPAALILNALYEFARRGRGTAFPYDAPRYLVTTGVYRYISNPMQVGIVLLMLGWGIVLDSSYVMLASGVALILFMVFKNVCNGSCRIGMTDPAWRDYQASVPRWIPWQLRVTTINIPP